MAISGTKGFFLLKERIFLVTGNKFPVTGRTNIIFLVAGNKIPVTGRTNNDLCHMKNISWHRRYTSCDRLNRNSDILDISCDKKISS